MQHYTRVKNRTLIQNGIGKDLAILANLAMASDLNSGMNAGSLPNGAPGGDGHIGSDVG
jgi:hypothetical protein